MVFSLSIGVSHGTRATMQMGGGQGNEMVDFPQTVAKWSVTLWHLLKAGRVSGQKLPRIPTVKEGQTSDGDLRAGWLREWRPR